MKANEAPEKIYVDSKAIGDDISTTVHTKRQDYPTCTEYTRTDAFIERAKEFLWEYIDGTDYHVNYILKEFEKYMED